ncbi:MAG: helicase-exonuclease AddAB subunit AddA, partial [Peptostreptococcaceae bacterium]|nr:helicase-exonuclease AddAB subunit AddA [Peptostreptococcaceae bacterium]
MKWTKEQQEAINLRNKNMLVAAAAGSGKTAVLVERIKQLVICDKISISEMLVVTFTNAAASEMKEKIIHAITKEIGKNTKESIFLRRQLNIIYKANISTFHSFALEVIRRYFYMIHIEPNFKICDEAENIILKTEAMEEMFDHFFESGDQGFIDFLNKYSASKNESKVKTIIESAYNLIQSIPDSFGWLNQNIESLQKSKEEFLDSQVAKEIKNTLKKNIRIAIKSFERAEELILEEGLPILAGKAKADVEQLIFISEGIEGNSLEMILEQISSIQFQRFNVSKDEKEGYEEIKGKIEKVRSKGKSFIGSIKEYYAVRSIDEYIHDLQMTYEDSRYLQILILDYHKRFKLKKEEKNLIDFNDIEHFALDILKNEEVAEEYRSKFKHVFVDEYQDSNLLQDTLISRIKRDNNLFMVGDVKQSIYKFRLAEPEIFMEKYEKYKTRSNERDAKIDLNQNFRSKGMIINAVNDIFSNIMDHYDSDAALYKGLEYAGNLDYPVELHVIDEKTKDTIDIDDSVLELKMAELEAHNAVKLIKGEIGREIFDVKQNKIRKITMRDIVVLLRATKNYADKFYQVFTEENIPAHVDDSEGYFDTIEIEIVLNLLRIIDNKRQDIPLISLLHSSIMDFSIAELSKIRGENKKGTFYNAFLSYGQNGENKILSNKVELAMEKIQAWQELSKFMPLDDLIWKLLRETGYYNYVAALPSGVQRQANLRLLIDKAIKFQSGSLKGLYGFITYIDAIKARSVRTGQVSLVGENDDVVRIMTIHKSKGLEFPVVLVAGLGKQFNQSRDTSYLDIHKDLGITLSYIEKERKYFRKTLLQNVIKEKNKSLGMDEEIRILYVAFTRAMDKLILLGTVKNSSDALEKYELTEKGDTSSARCYLDMIVPAAKASNIKISFHNRDEIVPLSSERNMNKNPVLELLKGTGNLQKDDLLATQVSKMLSYQYGFMLAINQKSKLSVTEINRELTKTEIYRENLRLPVFETGVRDFNGAEKGTIVHDFMMHLDFKEAYKALLVSKEKITDLLNNRLDKLVDAECFTKEERKVIQIEKIIGF